jgi:hypothetical protein
VHQIRNRSVDLVQLGDGDGVAPAPPNSYAQAQHTMPVLTVLMNRADLFFERDATGWQFIDLHTGRAAEYNLITTRPHRGGTPTGRPEDTVFQDAAKQSRRRPIPRGAP